MTQAHALKDMTGYFFGRLTVLRRDGSDDHRMAVWLCKCSCGTEKRISGSSLRKGLTVSCGCHGAAARLEASTKHGGARRSEKAAEYDAWHGMHSRCHSESNPNFKHYGGRGISVCESWSDFAAFLADMGPRPFPGATIERRNNEEGYSVANCYWATMRQQARNKRTNVPVIRSDGVRFGTIVEAAESTGVHPTGIRSACIGKQKTSGGYGWKFALLLALQ